MKKIRILVGIPCSGKSTYIHVNYITHLDTYYISRDEIRDVFKLHQYTKESEQKVTDLFKMQLSNYLSAPHILTIILDNTHVKEKYIDSIITEHLDCIIEIKFFDVSLLKAHYRNIIRYITTGKWIPISVMNNMYKSYNKINKQKYAKYMVH